MSDAESTWLEGPKTGQSAAHIVEVVGLGELVGNLSPRLTPVHDDHVAALVELIDQLPPILVHRSSMRIIDGVHRVEAYRRSGRSHIRAAFFSGDATYARVLAIQANTTHGLPLSRSERRTAALRLLEAYPKRSNRWVARICGMSHPTVGQIRREAAASTGWADSDRDADGGGARGTTATPVQRLGRASRRATPHIGDAAYRSSPEMERMVDWLTRTHVEPRDFDQFLRVAPKGRMYELADECRRRARVWAELTRRLEDKAR